MCSLLCRLHCICRGFFQLLFATSVHKVRVNSCVKLVNGIVKHLPVLSPAIFTTTICGVQFACVFIETENLAHAARLSQSSNCFGTVQFTGGSILLSTNCVLSEPGISSVYTIHGVRGKSTAATA